MFEYWVQCQKCLTHFDDAYCTTICPHQGIGFCVICDSVYCCCPVSNDNPRSQNYKGDGKA